MKPLLHEALLADIRAEFPSFAIVHKRDDALQRGAPGDVVKPSPCAPDVAAARLTPEEARARLTQSTQELDGEEFQNLSALIDWLQRRYPTPLDRLRYLRRKNADMLKAR